MKNSIGSKSRFLIGIITLFAILTVSNSCTKSTNNINTPGAGGGAGGPGANEVFMQSMAFTPSTLTVAAGTTVTWTNKDAVAHNVISTTPAGVLNSGTLSTNGVFSFTFPTAGTFNYVCTFHPGMTGKVVVN